MRALGPVVAAFLIAASFAAAAQDAPLLQGPASAIDAQRVLIQGTVVSLLGVDAPSQTQTCARAGARVACGAEAHGALDGLLMGRDVVCSVGRGQFRGGAPGRCWADGADVGARLVSAGWALSSDPIYAPLQAQAKQAGAGLWADRFQKPAVVRRAEANPWVPGLPGVPAASGLWSMPDGSKAVVGGAGDCALYSGILALKGGAKWNCVVTSPLQSGQ